MAKRKPLRFHRARKPAQIEQRREDILQAAIDLYEIKGLENVRLIDIAERIGIAKSNLYRYFESREHIYLQILQREGDAWEKRVILGLGALAGRGTIPKVAKIIARTFKESPRYCALMGVLTSVMQQKLSAERAANFRAVFFERRLRFARVVASSLPAASVEKISLLPLSLFAYVTGIWPLCHPPRETDAVFKRPEFVHLDLDFETEMTRHTELVLKGALQ